MTSTKERGATSHMSQMPHQRWAHKQIMTSGYRFLRNSNGHNLYENDHGQRISTAGSPKNVSQARKYVISEIRRQQREREALVNTKTTKPTTPLVALADPFLLKEPDKSSSVAVTARANAFYAWTRRALEKYGPMPAAVLEDAADEIGFGTSSVALARKKIGAVSYKSKKTPEHALGVWMVALPEQVPAEYAPRHLKSVELGVIAEAMEVPAEKVADAMMRAPLIREPITDVPLKQLQPENGHVSDTQAAALLLMESLGIKQPGAEATAALQQAHAACADAMEAIERALSTLR